ncbi:MAG: GNAT family N-acetyltransferase [Motiliproteus sp.]|nr:GNAT family N-acetyltransferase [Motiliproteus sp.]MCW9050979.1 GNAT family N-acetyltransferase [Motiliproteus sp.]
MADTLEETSRLRFRPLAMSDLEVVQQILGNPETMALSLLSPFTPLESEQRLQQMIDSSEFPALGKMAIIDKQQQRMIGYCGVEQSVLQDHLLYEFGIMMVSDSWGRGLASEAAAQVLDYQVQASKLVKVFALVDQRHKASKKVLQRAGMSFVRESIYENQSVDIYLLNTGSEKQTPR